MNTPRTFTLSETRGLLDSEAPPPTLRVKPENECSFSHETLYRVIEADPVLDEIERVCRFLPGYTILDDLRALLRSHRRLQDGGES